jgi:hypothetical protein
MQSDVMMANLPEKVHRTRIRAAILGFLNKLTPQGAEVALQFRKCIAWVEFGKPYYDAEGKELEAIGVAHEMDQVGE